MYYMVGLPTETMDDVGGIVEMGSKVKAIGKKYVGGRARVRVSTSNLVPKPHTPFQWARQDTGAELDPKHSLLSDGCRSSRRRVQLERPARQLRRVRASAAATAGWRTPCTRPGGAARSSTPGASTSTASVWRDAFEATGVDADWFAHREWDTREPLPWDHIDCGVTKSYLRGQWRMCTP